jgi:hypothetical protein
MFCFVVVFFKINKKKTSYPDSRDKTLFYTVGCLLLTSLKTFEYVY